MNETVRYEDWIGRTQTMEDVVDGTAATALSATLDRDDPPAGAGDPLPPGWHWSCFLEIRRASELGPDGHPKRGGFLPPVALPRRMWAGARLRFHRPLRIGEAITRTSTIQSVESKAGRSGQLVFVTVRHEIAGGGGPALTEEHDIVYRDAARPGETGPPPKPAPTGAEWSRTLAADPVMLFRYSAITFNGHRIHYDRTYATEVEGYPGLIVHGPLQATLLLDLIRRERPKATVTRFDFRALAPVFDIDAFSVNGRPTDGAAALWVARKDGALAMQAEADLA